MKITAESITEYFNYLYEELEGIAPQNVFNYNETNLTDNPIRKEVYCSLRFM